MDDLSFDAACRFLDGVMIPHSRTGSAIGRITAEVALCREQRSTLAECAHDLLVLLDEVEPRATWDERIGHAIDRLDQLVHRARSAAGGAPADRADKTITK